MSKNTILFDAQNSMASDVNDYEIQRIDWVQMRDSNNGNYGSNINKFDLEALANASYFTDFSSTYYFLPQVITISGVSKTATPENDYSVSLKASVMESINSVTIKLNDIQVNNPTQYLNKYANWELLHMSESDLKNIKDLIHFYPDSCTVNKASADSFYAPKDFENNNNIQPLADNSKLLVNGFKPDSFNRGRLERMKTTSFNPTRITTYYSANTFNGSLPPFEMNKSYVENSATNTTGTIKFTVFSIIPLPFLHPIFRSLPICRGVKLNLQITLNNQCVSTMKIKSADANTCSYITDSYTFSSSNGSNTCPFMVSPCGMGTSAGKGLVSDVTAGGETTIVIRNDVNTNGYQPVLYMPQIHFTEDFEAKYCAQEPKTIHYADYNVYNPTGLQSVGGGQSANQILITNSIVRPRDLIIIPEIAPEDNGKFLPSSTPFSSAPFTTAPYAKIYNFNVQINGQNIWSQTKKYTYESYVETMSHLALDGRQFRSFGISSGLISKSDWENCYTYYYVDLNRAKFSEDDNIGKSVNVTLTNGSGLKTNYTCILTYQRELELDVSTGKLVLKL